MPKLVNLVSHLVNRTDTATPLLAVTTALPGAPQLLWACVDPTRLTTPRKRFGEEAPHGLTSWVPRIDAQFGPDICQGDTSIWLGGPPCKTGEPCNYFIAQPDDTPPNVNWSTNVLPCTPNDTPPTGILTDPTGFIYNATAHGAELGWHNFSNDPPVGAGGSVINFPGGGSFSATFGAKFFFIEGQANPYLELRDQAGKPYKRTDPYNNDGRSCSGVAAQVKRTAVPAGGLTLSLWTNNDTPTDARWGFAMAAVFMVQYWPP